jgi:hypothetical protein
MAEITSPDYPGERLIACYNPFLAAERARKRGELVDATEAELARIAAATRRARRPLRGRGAIALAVGKVINKKKVAKHFIVDIADDGLTWRRDEQKIAEEAALDGIYVIRTSLPADALPSGDAVESYKGLENVERVFRGLNTDLLIRHRLEDRVRAHVLIRMLAYYITWHMQQRLAPMLFKDDDPRRRPRGPAQPGRPGAAVTGGAGQGRHQGHRRRRTGAQPPHPAGRPGHHHRQPHPARRPATRVHPDHHAHPPPAPGLRAARYLPPPRVRVVSRHQITARFRRQAPRHAPRGGNFGLVQRKASGSW